MNFDEKKNHGIHLYMNVVSSGEATKTDMNKAYEDAIKF